MFYCNDLPRTTKRIIIKPTASSPQARTMAFFPRHLYNTGAPEAAFLRLFHDVESAPRVPRQTYQPKFDVREVGNAYELYGELPGVSRENVSIEFTEQQTMLVKGKAERNYTTGLEETEDTAMAVDAQLEEDQQPKGSPRQATVEDEIDSEAHESGFEEVVTRKAPEQPAVEKKQPVDKAKYWLNERSVGEFARTFKFPSHIDQEGVTASFNDGILAISIPKAKKPEARRIAIY